MKKIAIIPILLGSKRVKDKNLLLVDGEPLVSYVIKSVIQSEAFDEIYIDSEHQEFERFAKEFNIGFNYRDKTTGGSHCNTCKGRCQVHDHYLVPFLAKHECEYLIQIHTTSPLIKPETIWSFAKELENYDTLIGAIDHQIEALDHNDDPLNFNLKIKQPTQKLDPIKTIAWSLAGWNKKAFITNKNHGPTFSGKTGFFTIPKIEALDVDTFEDLFIVEACLNHLKRKDNVAKQYLDFESTVNIERDLLDLIKKDGSPVLFDHRNKRKTNVQELRNLVGNQSCAFPIVWTDNDQVCFIQQNENEGSRFHYHPTKDEFWIIFEGEFKYEIGYAKNEILIAKKGDIVYIEKGVPHKITCTSKQPGVRLACGENNFSHVYVRE